MSPRLSFLSTCSLSLLQSFIHIYLISPNLLTLPPIIRLSLPPLSFLPTFSRFSLPPLLPIYSHSFSFPICFPSPHIHPLPVCPSLLHRLQQRRPARRRTSGWTSSSASNSDRSRWWRRKRSLWKPLCAVLRKRKRGKRNGEKKEGRNKGRKVEDDGMEGRRGE